MKDGLGGSWAGCREMSACRLRTVGCSTRDVLVVSRAATASKMEVLSQFMPGLRMGWVGYLAGETQLDSQG